MKYNCLIVDDEEALGSATCEYFNMFDVSTAFVTNYDDCIDFLNKNNVDLLLLDINIGEKSGFQLCKEIRKITNIPILFLSARDSDEDILIALNIGGDDYIKKPCSLSVLLAKVKVTLKRYEDINKELINNSIEIVNNIKLDKSSMKVYVDNKEIEFKAKEFSLLYYLIKNKNKVLSKEELFKEVWGEGFDSDGTLNVHIRRIREKIEENPNEPVYIKTVWGIGYIFECNEK